MNRDEVLKVAKECFTDKEFSAVTYESGPYDITNPTLGLKHFAAAMYAKGAEAMRERAAGVCHDLTKGGFSTEDEMECVTRTLGVANAAIRALPITTEGKQG